VELGECIWQDFCFIGMWISDKTERFAGFSGSFLLFKFAAGTKCLPLRKGMVIRMIIITRLEQIQHFE